MTNDQWSRAVRGDWMLRCALLVIGHCALVIVFAGCSQLAAYDRTYSLSYTGTDGQQLGGSVTLKPAKTGGLAK